MYICVCACVRPRCLTPVCECGIHASIPGNGTAGLATAFWYNTAVTLRTAVGYCWCVCVRYAVIHTHILIYMCVCVCTDWAFPCKHNDKEQFSELCLPNALQPWLTRRYSTVFSHFALYEYPFELNTTVGHNLSPFPLSWVQLSDCLSSDRLSIAAVNLLIR